MRRLGWCAIFIVLMSASVWASEIRIVEHVIDGDTVVLDHKQKARLIGVDTPEMNDLYRNMRNAYQRGVDSRRLNAYAGIAKAFLKTAIEGRTVRLEYDREPVDKYGRQLVYLYRLPDDAFINAAIVREGLGFTYTRFPFKYSEEFKRYELEARAARRGIWH